MPKPPLPLNALRAFETSARHLSFTRAGLELGVTQAAVSHHVKGLEARLGAALFHRLPRGLALTDEGQSLLPMLQDALARIEVGMARFEAGHVKEVLTVGVVGTFALGWLLPRLGRFRETRPFVDLRIATHNNRVDLAGEGLDAAIRFGDGAWHGTEAVPLFRAPMTPLSSPTVAARLRVPTDLAGELLLRSYRGEAWAAWLEKAGVPTCPSLRGPIFDSSLLMVEAASMGLGVALAPASMFNGALSSGRLVAPFSTEVDVGGYWLSWLKSKPTSPGMQALRDWLAEEVLAAAEA